MNISIFGVNINILSLVNLNENTQLDLSNIEFIRFDKKKSFLLISQSDLSKCSFSNINFSIVDNLVIGSSNLNNASFKNVKWRNDINKFDQYLVISDLMHKLRDVISIVPYVLKVDLHEILSNTIKDLNTLQKLNQKKFYAESAEIYKQLKFAFSKTGDKVQEKYFHALEMRNLDKSLKWLSKNFFTKSILRLSYWFSDFGQSVSRPVLGMLIIYWFYFMFLVYKGHFNDLEITYPLSANCQGFDKGLIEYVKLLNPIRKELGTNSGQIASLDLLIRIISSFMLYNFARATRQYIN